MTEADIGALAAELAVRNLIARVAQLADTGDLEEYGACWTQDGAWVYPGSPIHGRAAIVAAAAERRRLGTTGPGSGTRHMITTLRVQVDSADTVTAVSYFTFLGHVETGPKLLVMGA
jgi:uncharacterized protein (TIGR02246 family)